MFATGYAQLGLEAAYGAVPVMQKPYQAAQMEHLLVRLLTGELPDRQRSALRHGAGCSYHGGGSSFNRGRFRPETLS